MTLEQLKQIAEEVGYQVHHMAGYDKVKKGLQDYCEDKGINMEEVASKIGIEVIMSSVINDSKIDENKKDEPKVTSVKKEAKKEDLISKLSNLTFQDAEAVKNKQDSATRLKEAGRLVRCIISTNNKNKSQYMGEIFTVRNKFLPEKKKMIPFNVPVHVPKIILNVIKEKQYQTFVSKKKPDGSTDKKPKLIPEYNIQYLDPLTTAEFEAIKQKQLAEGFDGS